MLVQFLSPFGVYNAVEKADLAEELARLLIENGAAVAIVPPVAAPAPAGDEAPPQPAPAKGKKG